ncbi:hypothetical protein BH23BAC1_BH23BAC1_23080 [soil metagenome]
MENEDYRVYTVKEKTLEEGNKLFYDVFKHLTTLSTGSILILVAFLENLFVNPQYKFLIAISLLCFIINTVGAARMMFFQAHAVMSLKESTDKMGKVSFMVTVSSFLIGITSFVVFALLNF